MRSPLSPASATIESVRLQHRLHNGTLIGFGLTLAVLIAGGGVGYVNVRRLAANEQKVTRTHMVIGELDSLLSTLKDAETGQRGYLLAIDEKYLQPYDDALTQVGIGVVRLKDLLADNPDQLIRLAVLQRRIALRLDELNRTVALMKGGDRDAAVAIVRSDEGRILMDDVRAAVADMQRAEEDLVRQRGAESQASFSTTVLLLLLTAAIGVALVCIVFYLSQRNLAVRQRTADVLADQRERLRVTLASIGDAVITTDVDSRITYLNPVAESLTGWTQDQAVGQPLDAVFRIVNEETRQDVPDPAQKALREGIVIGLANHTLLITKDGTEQPIDDSASPIRDRHGHVVGCVLVFRDIAERRRVEQERANASARVESVVNHAIDGIIAIDENGAIEAFNPAAEKLFGYPAHAVIGQNVKLLMPEPFRGEHDGYLANYRRTGQAKIIGAGREVEGRRKDGSTFPMELAVSEFWLGQRRYFTGIVRDITERKRIERQTYDLLIELKEGDRRKDEFLATLAHELRGPLAPLRSMLEVMQRAGDDRGALQQARGTMERQLGQLVRLVDDLIDVSRITRNKIELRRERVELASVIHQSLEACRPLTESAHHQVDVTLSPEPMYVHADAVRLTQVFSNLLNNACKYTEPGGRISLTAERDGADVVVKVTDTGIGIPADELGNVFEMFAQVDRTSAGSQAGLGIGLTLVKRLVEMHDGTVTAHSEGPGRGSEFVVRLPLVQQPEAEAREPIITAPVVAPARRFLVVDDNTDAASSLAMLLQLTGNETRTAHDGLEAVEAAESFRPNVVLLDIGLPRLNGYDTCRRIREQPWGKTMTIVALTGWGQEEDRRKSKDAGFDHHMTKPIDYRTLMNLLAPAQKCTSVPKVQPSREPRENAL